MSEEMTLKAKVMNAYSELVRNDRLLEARAVLRFLRDGKTNLGLGDVSSYVEGILEALGCRIRYSRNFNIARVYLLPEA